MSDAKLTRKDDPRPRCAFGAAEVLERLSYDAETGVFRWKIRVQCHGGGRRPGDAAGTNKDGYVVILLFGRQYRAHHLAWLVMTGEWPPIDRDIDHENRVRSDNRWGNLRLATRAQNNLNSGKRHDNSSGFKGVHRLRKTGSYYARIQHAGKIIHLGVFKTKELAAAARAEAELKFYGEFAQPNQGTPCQS